MPSSQQDSAVQLPLPVIWPSSGVKEKSCARSNGRGLGCPRPHTTSLQAVPELEGMSVNKNLPRAEALTARLIMLASHDLVGPNLGQRTCVCLEGRTKTASKPNRWSGVSNVGALQLQARC